jgi:hypothetical protein
VSTPTVTAMAAAGMLSMTVPSGLIGQAPDLLNRGQDARVCSP